MKHLLLTTFCLLLCTFSLMAQRNNNARIIGNIQSNANFFVTDSAIGAFGTPQYDYQKFGAETWLNLNYSNWGFDVNVRFDMFNTSNLLNPNGSFTGKGIGRWFIRKSIDKFDVSAGYIYDQIGSGIIFRAYEERSLLIDNALLGARVGYQINKNWKAKAFMGQVKRQFDLYGATIRGANIEGFIQPDSTKNFSLAPGFGVVGRTYDDETVDQIVKTISTYAPQDSTGAQYNTYAATLYNTLTAGPVNWYIEGALKTNDVINDPLALTVDGVRGKLSSLSYAKKGLGITLELKRSKDFSFRNSPFVIGVQGAINFLPPMAKQNTYRLTARFSPNTQELGEQAIQLDVKYKINKKLSVGLNFSDITLIDGGGFLNLNGVTQLYREIAPEFTFKHKRKWQFIGGVQFLEYNIGLYQGKGDFVHAVTPFAEWLYKFSPRKSLRIEAQYLSTEEEFGSWANVLAEFGWAPHWLIYASDMYKVPHQDPNKYTEEKIKYDGLHYPSVGVVYSIKASRFSLAYVKQVEGINCAGGICRYEPTFHGVRVQFTSNF